MCVCVGGRYTYDSLSGSCSDTSPSHIFRTYRNRDPRGGHRRVPMNRRPPLVFRGSQRIIRVTHSKNSESLWFFHHPQTMRLEGKRSRLGGRRGATSQPVLEVVWEGKLCNRCGTKFALGTHLFFLLADLGVLVLLRLLASFRGRGYARHNWGSAVR